MTLDDVIHLLQQAAREPGQLAQQIGAFQAAIWNDQVLGDLDDEVMEVLRELAQDLDFYEPDPKLRSEDESYFGEDRALAEIQSALNRVASLSRSLNRGPGSHSRSDVE
jgi:hypothetical protein